MHDQLVRDLPHKTFRIRKTHHRLFANKIQSPGKSYIYEQVVINSSTAVSMTESKQDKVLHTYTILWAGRSWDRILEGGEIFCTSPDQLWGPTNLLSNGYRVFPGGKAAGAWRWPPIPSSAEVKKRVQLYLYPLLAFVVCLAWTLLDVYHLCTVRGDQKYL